MQTSPQPTTIKVRVLSWVTTTSALSSVAIAALLWASPTRALPFTSTPTWTFTSPTPATGDLFGISVALNGNTALIGALGDNNNASSAYLFDVSSGTRLRTFLSPNPGAGDEFGISVALSGNTALIGADGDSRYTGAAYVYASTSSQSVPGPLPLLGLGAAFAWSRKLRRRIHTQATQRSVEDSLPSPNERQ